MPSRFYNGLWMNSQISDTMKERDWAHRKARKSNLARHWSMYAKLRNKVNGLVRTAKSKYYCDMIEEVKGDSEKAWKAVNEACNRNSSSESIQCIISDGVQHITSQSIGRTLFETGRLFKFLRNNQMFKTKL